MGAIDNYSVNDPPVDSWDEYFYNVCRQVARNSKCFSRKIGAVIVKDKSIIGTGYNSPPRGIPPCDKRWNLDIPFANKYGKEVLGKERVVGRCPRHVLGYKSGEGLDICIAGHAEENAIVNAARNGINVYGSTMAASCGIPCSKCLIKIINAGIKEIVVTSMNTYDESAMYLLTQSNLKYRLFDFIK